MTGLASFRRRALVLGNAGPNRWRPGCEWRASSHRLTGLCPTVALDGATDFPLGLDSVPAVKKMARSAGLEPGAIYPDAMDSLGHPDPQVRRTAVEHLLVTAEIAKETRLP